MMLTASFQAFVARDASGDDSPLTTLESSALEVSYLVNPGEQGLAGVDILARQGNTTLKLGEHDGTLGSNLLVSLDGFTDLTGSWEVFASARTTGGAVTESAPVSVIVLPTTAVSGDYLAETFTYTASPLSATVYSGGGGTDTLSLYVLSSGVVSFNGAALAALAPNSLVASQALYAGTAFDYLRLADGSEVYLQGIERLRFADGSITELQTRPNDTRFNEQWNLAIADVPDAWRFTRGSDDVLVVSLDTGIPISNGTATFDDLESDRLIFRGNASGSDHGHQAVSIIGAEANNNDGITGINWESPVLVLDVYGGDAGNIGINTAIQTALNELNSIPASRIVFQGGIQGEFWLNVLNQSVLPGIEDNTLFAIAAGNGGQDISLTSHPSGLSGGVARLEAVYDNFIAVGALSRFGNDFVDGQQNASSVGLAGFSNFGENLTLVAPQGVPAQRSNGSNGFFTGTSAANPVAAGYSSLVWSVNPGLTGGEVRQILTETATDLGSTGRDTTYGHGVPSAGAAVRRAWALGANSDLANLGVNHFSAAPELPGDFNLDGVVDTADYTVWRDSYGASQVQFTGADVSGNGLVDLADHAVWLANFGASFVTTPLINATLGNGEFAVDSVNDVAPLGNSANPSINLDRDRALLPSQAGGQGLSIDGWEITRVNYPGGNNAFGFDGLYGFATDAGTGAGQTGQAFVNSGVVELRSDRIDLDFSAGDPFTLSYLLGSDTANADPTATARLIFDEGLATEFIHTFETDTATALGTPAFQHEFELPAAASSVTLAFTLNGSVSGNRALLDRVELSTVRPGFPNASSAATSLAFSPVDESIGRAPYTGGPADNFPAVGEFAAEVSPAAEAPVVPPFFAEPLAATRPGVAATPTTAVTPQVADEALLLLDTELGIGSADDSTELSFQLNDEVETDVASVDDALLAVV